MDKWWIKMNWDDYIFYPSNLIKYMLAFYILKTAKSIETGFSTETVSSFDSIKYPDSAKEYRKNPFMG